MEVDWAQAQKKNSREGIFRLEPVYNDELWGRGRRGATTITNGGISWFSLFNIVTVQINCDILLRDPL